MLTIRALNWEFPERRKMGIDGRSFKNIEERRDP
jgi:hypothetical protein